MRSNLCFLGAFLGSAGLGASLIAKDVFAQHASGIGTPPANICGLNHDIDDENCVGEPGETCPVDTADDALEGHKAYDENGSQIFFGTGKCSDDTEIFHFNGTEFAYAGTNLMAEHHHHGSHNSY